MTFDEIVKFWQGNGDTRRGVRLGVGADLLAEKFPETSAGLLLARTDQQKARAAIDGVAAELGSDEVCVLLMRESLTDLEPAHILDGARVHGLRIVGVHETEGRFGRTAIVLTADPSVAVRRGVALTELPDSPATDAAIRNEWMVQGPVLRAQLTAADVAVKGRRGEASILRQERNAARERWDAEKATTAQLRREIAQLRQNSGPGGAGERVKRAVHEITRDPIGGSRKVAKAVKRLTKS